MDLEHVEINGVKRYCGLLPTKPETRKLFKAAGETVPDLPKSEYRDISNIHFTKAPVDQNGQGSCVGASGVSVVMNVRARMGLPHVELSIASLYGQINGGRDQGASLGDALIALKEVGCCSTATIDRYDWQKARRTDAWKKEALLYRIDESYLCSSIKEFIDGLQMGFVGQFGVAANNSYYVDDDGYMPANRGGINHAVAATGMKRRANGAWYIEQLGSWGAWGWKGSGFGYYPVDSLQEDELWLIRSVIVPSTTEL